MFLCPHCEKSCAPPDRRCGACERDLDWLKQVPRLRDALLGWGTQSGPLTTTAMVPVPIEPVSFGLPALREIDLPTRREETLTLGRSLNSSKVLPDPCVEMVHCVLIWQENTQQYWVADHRSETGTFVNGRPVVAQPLRGGDLLQVGPYAWTFSPLDRRLVQVGRIRGVNVDVQDISVGWRLQKVSFQLNPGEFVAVIGPSGHGKSTLIRSLIHDPSTPSEGQMLVNGQDVKQRIAWFRSQLGYVAQHAALQDDLPAQKMVAFAATLRGAASETGRQVLKEVDFPQSRLRALCRELSGGESKRLRLAAELVAAPGLLVLDEPGSGLDEGHEEGMMRLMQQRARRGGTILMVTHNLQLLTYCDRVLVIQQDENRIGRLFFDGSPQQLRQRMPSGNFEELTLEPADHRPPGLLSESKPGVPHARPPQSFPTVKPAAQPGFFGQLLQIIHRECVLLFHPHRQTLFRRLLLPVVVLPVCFAGAIGASVPGLELETLGFLSILACIWMGASLSLMAIVDEREAYDHERLLCLRMGAYVTAKMIVLGTLALVQCLLFSALLWGVRWKMFTSHDDIMFFHPVGALACLVPVSLAATGLGLFISALSKTSRPAANFILPLVMMAQIVFSVQIAIGGDKSLKEAYREFQLPRPQQVSAAGQENGPPAAVVVASYVTLSRYGDIALRSFAYSSLSKLEDFRRERWTALGRLLALSVALPILAVGLLWVQERFGATPGR